MARTDKSVEKRKCTRQFCLCCLYKYNPAWLLMICLAIDMGSAPATRQFIWVKCQYGGKRPTNTHDTQKPPTNNAHAQA